MSRADWKSLGSEGLGGQVVRMLADRGGGRADGMFTKAQNDEPSFCGNLTNDDFGTGPEMPPLNMFMATDRLGREGRLCFRSKLSPQRRHSDLQGGWFSIFNGETSCAPNED